mmetsp:Transcript_39879/g.129640  ORF Transcript_39879/g.129640 Transcript_39879/m.129640 type:complete len:262 (+) Transcript_39879:27-812(+)
MGNAVAREAQPVVQRLISRWLLRSRLEVALAGLDGSGKSALARALAAEPPLAAAPSLKPTIGLVVQRVQHSGLDLSLWDLGGRQRFRFDWARHVSGCDALLFLIDVSDRDRLAEARQALHMLLDDPRLRGLPLLVVASKCDTLQPRDRAELERLGWAPLSRLLNLDCVTEQSWSVLGVSAADGLNLPALTRWLVLRAHSGRPPREGALGEGASRWLGGGAQRHGQALLRRLMPPWLGLRGGAAAVPDHESTLLGDAELRPV